MVRMVYTWIMWIWSNHIKDVSWTQSSLMSWTLRTVAVSSSIQRRNNRGCRGQPWHGAVHNHKWTECGIGKCDPKSFIELKEWPLYANVIYHNWETEIWLCWFCYLLNKMVGRHDGTVILEFKWKSCFSTMLISTANVYYESKER